MPLPIYAIAITMSIGAVDAVAALLLLPLLFLLLSYYYYYFCMRALCLHPPIWTTTTIAIVLVAACSSQQPFGTCLLRGGGALELAHLCPNPNSIDFFSGRVLQVYTSMCVGSCGRAGWLHCHLQVCLLLSRLCAPKSPHHRTAPISSVATAAATPVMALVPPPPSVTLFARLHLKFRVLWRFLLFTFFLICLLRHPLRRCMQSCKSCFCYSFGCQSQPKALCSQATKQSMQQTSRRTDCCGIERPSICRRLRSPCQAAPLFTSISLQSAVELSPLSVCAASGALLHWQPVRLPWDTFQPELAWFGWLCTLDRLICLTHHYCQNSYLIQFALLLLHLYVCCRCGVFSIETALAAIEAGRERWIFVASMCVFCWFRFGVWSVRISCG